MAVEIRSIVCACMCLWWGVNVQTCHVFILRSFPDCDPYSYFVYSWNHSSSVVIKCYALDEEYTFFVVDKKRLV